MTKKQLLIQKKYLALFLAGTMLFPNQPYIPEEKYQLETEHNLDNEQEKNKKLTQKRILSTYQQQHGFARKNLQKPNKYSII